MPQVENDYMMINWKSTTIQTLIDKTLHRKLKIKELKSCISFHKHYYDRKLS